MGRASVVLTRMREICLSLPDTKETLTWGEPHFRVGEKIFAGCGEGKGVVSIGFKLEMEHALDIIQDPRFTKAPYVGHKGWVSMDAAGITSWDEVRELIHESYRLIAPKKSLAKLGTDEAPSATTARNREPAKAATGRRGEAKSASPQRSTKAKSTTSSTPRSAETKTATAQRATTTRGAGTRSGVSVKKSAAKRSAASDATSAGGAKRAGAGRPAIVKKSAAKSTAAATRTAGTKKSAAKRSASTAPDTAARGAKKTRVAKKG
ncbi:MmcQ/YjbR family DNA-binding protein [Chondromyces crocatus]|uniref:MmcQ/YjbR family DNA-binding protein n=1 Tax=Chondromyces crocatus TaxID=52 RepID=A0A0K1ESD4_CHOCO|nr:MmcQ/YjbR family DNA-binding protein [Chondromyces crocatus]AKT43845.1 uncharacterized protein CMC5_080820 [Chondromyces crocatus]